MSWGEGGLKAEWELPESFCSFYSVMGLAWVAPLAGKVISLPSNGRIPPVPDSGCLCAARCWESTFNLGDFLPCISAAHQFPPLLAPDLEFDLR